MTTAEPSTRLDAIVRPIVQSLGLELVEIAFSGRAKKGLLRITIDRDGGVGIEECERVSKLVGHALDAADPIENAYRLEVSSPGLDRPLKSRHDFIKYRGRLAKITTRIPIHGERVQVGRLGELDGDVLRLVVSEERETRIALGDIAHARLEVEW